MAGSAGMSTFNELAVAARVVGDPDRRPRFGCWFGLDGDVFAAIVLALEGEVVLSPQTVDERDPFDQALDAVLVLESVELAFDPTTSLGHDPGAGDQNGPATGEQIQACPLIGQQNRITER